MVLSVIDRSNQIIILSRLGRLRLKERFEFVVSVQDSSIIFSRNGNDDDDLLSVDQLHVLLLLMMMMMMMD